MHEGHLAIYCGAGIHAPTCKNPSCNCPCHHRDEDRPSWDEYFAGIAEAVSKRATCPRASVGAVIVSEDNRILSTGYNGSTRGDLHCTDPESIGGGCLIEDGHCQRALHAEVNAVAHAARAGVSLKGSRIYIYLAVPGHSSSEQIGVCRECSKVLRAAEIGVAEGISLA